MIRRNFIEKLYAEALAMTLLLTMAGCSEEERPAVDPHDQQTFEDDLGNARFEVVDEFDPTGTRATISGYAMSWENVTGNAATKDAIGVYGVNSNGVVRYANVKVEYRDGAWKAASNIVASGTMTYYAYYPYQSSLSGGPAAGANVGLGLQADKFFATAITNWVPKNDQSTLANFNASDLCVSRAYCDGSGKVTFTLLHQMGLAVLNLQTKTVTLTTTTITTYTASHDASIQWSDTETTTNNSYTLPPSTTWGTSSFTNIVTNTTSTVTNKPLLISSGDRRYYFIAKPGQNYTLKATSGGTTDYEKGAWQQSVTGSSGRYYAYSPTIADGNKTRTVNVNGGLVAVEYSVGQVVCSDGTLVDKGVTVPSNKTAIGIICYANYGNGTTEGNLITEKAEGYGHGLVIATNDCMDGNWANSERWAVDLPDNLFPNVGYTISGGLTDLQGIAKNRYVFNNQASTVGTSNTCFLTAWKLQNEGFVNVLGKMSSSRWFLPSAGQMLRALENLGCVLDGPNDVIYQGTINTTYNSSKIKGLWAFDQDYWTSSECENTTAFMICLSGEYITDQPKDSGSSDTRFRPVFAF